MGFLALPFIPFPRESLGGSLVPGAELHLRNDVEEEDPSPAVRGGFSPLPAGLEEPLCGLRAGRGPSALSPSFLQAISFSALLRKSLMLLWF